MAAAVMEMDRSTGFGFGPPSAIMAGIDLDTLDQRAAGECLAVLESMKLSTHDIRLIAARMNVDLDSISLPDGYNLSDDDDDDEIREILKQKQEEEELTYKTNFLNTIVVDNSPVVPEVKFKKLEQVILKIYGQFGPIEKDGLWMPVDPETGKTVGYCFIEFNTPEEAELAKKKTHGYKLDKSHIFSVNMFDDIETFSKVPELWIPPEIKPYTPWENLQKWLVDGKARDQFVNRAGTDTEVFWNDARQSKPDPVFKKSYWTESFVQWSPLGTYLATLHMQGVAVWGGAFTFNRLMRYKHHKVKLIDFSPNERFLVTYSSQEPSHARDTRRVLIIIFDVRSGKMVTEFSSSADELASSGVSWPVFRWGGGREDKYFARIGKNVIRVYETETFSLIGKESIRVENVADFSWSPSDTLLALFIPESGGGNQPARVSLVQIPSKEELRQKNLFSVSDCKMYWQSDGAYLAVEVDRYTKTKKRTYTSFELFRIKERDIPVEVLELENKNDTVIAFAWEPKGQRFAVIHGDNPRPDVSFYSMHRVSKLTTLKGKQANAIYWSPAGRFVILAGLKGFNGQLEFYDVDGLETMAQVEHFMATDVEWDPSGRFVVTAVTSVHEMENGFNVWSFCGKLLYRILKDHLFQFMWRPRPPSFLTGEEDEEIARNLKKYSKRYEAEDEDVCMLLSEQDREERRTLKEEWEMWVSEWKRLHEEEKLERQKLCDGEESDVEEQDYEAKQVEIEELLDVSEVVIV